jgi:hypothetical protein
MTLDYSMHSSSLSKIVFNTITNPEKKTSHKAHRNFLLLNKVCVTGMVCLPGPCPMDYRKVMEYAFPPLTY